MSNPVREFKQALLSQRVAELFSRTSSIWNSSWHQVRVSSDGWVHTLKVSRVVSPVGLDDDTSERICKDLKAESSRDLDKLLGDLKIKPKTVKPDTHVFLGGVGDSVEYSFTIAIYAKDDKQSAALAQAFAKLRVTS